MGTALLDRLVEEEKQQCPVCCGNQISSRVGGSSLSKTVGVIVFIMQRGVRRQIKLSTKLWHCDKDKANKGWYSVRQGGEAQDTKDGPGVVIGI
ncbi:hypothetical protein E2C01_083522 [Portunus trituberculatus]|uniref:Uncharacterized protein n=1 Tax=Portunus trituberculatus TaxID=210409 RepID=A0A5B7J4W9_PORTR|nr:hypothetical protein [Portunus trituberculatus]